MIYVVLLLCLQAHKIPGTFEKKSNIITKKSNYSNLRKAEFIFCTFEHRIICKPLIKLLNLNL
jgi:hypothetical protein